MKPIPNATSTEVDTHEILSQKKQDAIADIKEVLYIDMDNVIVDFPSGIKQLDAATLKEYEGNYDEVPGIFATMEPMPGAIAAVKELCRHFDVFVLSTAPWLNPSAWTDKLLWIQKYFGKEEGTCLYKRLILSHHKDLNAGHWIIDDRLHNGVSDFKGTHIHFGQEGFMDWETVLAYFLEKKAVN